MMEMLMITDALEVLGKIVPFSDSSDVEGFWEIFAMAPRNMYFVGMV